MSAPDHDRWTDIVRRLYAWYEQGSGCDLTDLHPGLRALGAKVLDLPDRGLMVGDPYDVSTFRRIDQELPYACQSARAYAITTHGPELQGTRVALLILNIRLYLTGAGLRDPWCWEPALFEGGKETFSVDRARAGYMDVRTWKAAKKDVKYVKKVEAAFEGSDFDVLPYKRKSVLACATGLGDGAYASWLLKDAAGTPISFLTDFGILGRVLG